MPFGVKDRLGSVLLLQMKSSEIDQELFTESYCRVCSAQLISESQRVAHYESRKHASKVRLYYMLHPVDGGCPAKKLRSENDSGDDSVDKNKCCTLCNMSFTSAVVAESHYQGKIHAKRLKLLLGVQPTLKATETSLSSLQQPHMDGPPAVCPPHQRRDSDRYCQLCAAWFNNPMMAQQHYDGKKHKKNAARAGLLEQLGKTLDLGEVRGLKRTYTCNICNVTLNSIEQYHAHLKGSKHQNNGWLERNYVKGLAEINSPETKQNGTKFECWEDPAIKSSPLLMCLVHMRCKANHLREIIFNASLCGDAGSLQVPYFLHAVLLTSGVFFVFKC